jgi:tetratricopeptide (TPR) repeat protein
MSTADEETSQELEEDGRIVVAVYRNSEDDRLYRVYFADATFLEIAGMEAIWEEGHAPDEGEEVEPGETGWEACLWRDLPWRVRERVRTTLEDAMRPLGEELARDLLSHPYEEQLRLAVERSDLHEWSLAHVILEKSQAAAPSDPQKAAEFARVAERLTHFFPGYKPERVFELRARCLAHLASAFRILGEFQSAEEAFREGLLSLDQGGEEFGLVRAEILSLRASYLRDLRRLDEALELLKEARWLYEGEGATSHVVRVLEEQAKILEELDDPEGAWGLLQEARRVMGT